MTVNGSALHRENRGPGLLSGSYAAKVTKAAMAGEPLVLTIPGTEDAGTLELDAPNWIAKPSGTPEVGDECLVVLDASGGGWVVAWAGQGG
jgi:hypothetical protein